VPFSGSHAYWKQRYDDGGNSGPGSYGHLAEFKNSILNRFVGDYQVQSVIEFGCGDGNQLRNARYPHYLGFDISEKAVALCHHLFVEDATKLFRLMDDYAGETAELSLSLDVIFHLVEDAVFASYMRRLFAAAERYVIIYSSNSDDNAGAADHVRHRCFTDWVDEHARDWALLQRIPNPYPYRGDFTRESFADFYVYEKRVR